VLDQRLEVLHGNTAGVLFFVRNTLSAGSIKKICQLLRRGKRTSEAECGEGQNFLGSYSWSMNGAGGGEGKKVWVSSKLVEIGAWKKNEFADVTEEFIQTRAHFTPDAVMKSNNLSLFCSYQFYLSSGLAEFGPISPHLHQGWELSPASNNFLGSSSPEWQF